MLWAAPDAEADGRRARRRARFHARRGRRGSPSPAAASGFAVLPALLRRLLAGSARTRWALPGLLVALLFAFAGASLYASHREQARAVAVAGADLDALAAIVADDLSLRLRLEPNRSPADALRAAATPAMLRRGQRALLGDGDGAVVASTGAAGGGSTLAAELGPAQPLTILADRAGVLRMTLPNGAQALATVRAVGTGGEQLAMIQPLDAVLERWETTLVRTVASLAAVGALLAVVLVAYARQAARANRARLSYRLMRERVDMVLSHGRCGLWDWHLGSGRVEWSHSMFEILGLSAGAAAMRFDEVDALIHEADGGLDALARSLKGGPSGDGGTGNHVFRMRAASGDWRWLRAKVEMVGTGRDRRLVGIAIDITDTLALEERSARADMRLRDAIEAISEAFVVWDAGNRLVLCNSKFQRFHDLPAEAVAAGTPYAAVMERGTPPLIQSHVVLDAGDLGEVQPMGARTFEAQLADGRWLQVNERRTKDGGYVSVGTDITALKRHEEQLIESERRLMNMVIDLRRSRQKLETQAQQLAELAEKHLERTAEAETASRAKSDFLANMSHELRTPLNAILGFSEIMTLESFGRIGSPHYLDYSRHIHSSGQQLLALITDILEMSRLDAGRVRLEKRAVPLAVLVEGVLPPITALAEQAGVALDCAGVEAEAVYADRNALEKILTILLNNAVKYTPGGGRIALRAREAEGAVLLSVADSGVGMPPEAVARLGRPFEQFTRTLHNGMRGSGLGLAIARSLVELHGGTVLIESREGVGTTVHVRLPGEGAAEAAPGGAGGPGTTPPAAALPPPRQSMPGRAAAKLSRAG